MRDDGKGRVFHQGPVPVLALPEFPHRPLPPVRFPGERFSRFPELCQEAHDDPDDDRGDDETRRGARDQIVGRDPPVEGEAHRGDDGERERFRERHGAPKQRSSADRVEPVDDPVKHRLPFPEVGHPRLSPSLDGGCFRPF